MIWNSVAERANGTNIIKAEKIGSAVIFLRMIAEIIRLMCITVKNMRKENELNTFITFQRNRRA